MKLSTKITAAAVGLLLFLSQIFSIGNLVEMQRKMIGNIMEYEWLELIEKSGRFADELWKWEKTNAEEADYGKMKVFYGRMIFYGDSYNRGVLYHDGKEIVNASPYEFQVENGTPVAAHYFSEEIPEEYRKNTFLETLNGKHLLILYCDVQDFRILCYRDISSVYRNCRMLFIRGIAEAVALACLLAVVLSLIIKKIMKPFGELTEAANRIACGDYTKRVENLGKDEIGALSGSFNQMADKVQMHVDALTEMNENQQLLLGALAHELKTPMTGIQGYAQLLQKVELSPERQAAALGYIEEECKRLSRLSSKMLQITELSEETQIEKKKIRILDLFQKAEESAGYSLRRKKLRLEICCPKNLEVQGDGDLLSCFLTNLIDNACKASEEGGCIRLLGTAEGIFVEDDGRGIPKEEIRKVTEPFYMVDKSRSRKEGGTGLGLALCSRIAKLHGGSLSITSEVGKGSKIGLLWGTDAQGYRGRRTADT